MADTQITGNLIFAFMWLLVIGFVGMVIVVLLLAGGINEFIKQIEKKEGENK